MDSWRSAGDAPSTREKPIRLSTPSNVEISRVLSHALRHKPWLYELELDEEGWAPLDAVVEAVRAEGRGWETLTQADVEDVVRTGSGGRHEIANGRIRAVYGHSIPARVVFADAIPPEILFHGTTASALASIHVQGLRPMSRQYVHCSPDRETAVRVGRRKGTNVVVLTIDAARAAAAGHRFHRGNERVWLCAFIPPEFVRPEPGDPAPNAARSTV